MGMTLAKHLWPFVAFPVLWVSCLAGNGQAAPLFTVTDLGLGSPSNLSNPGNPDGSWSFLDMNVQNRLQVDSAGQVTSAPFPTPVTASWNGANSQVVPYQLWYNGQTPDAVVLSQAGNNVAGWGTDASRNWRGFASINGQAMLVGPLPGDVFSQATGVNKAGQVVGLSSPSGFNGKAFLFSPQTGIQAIPLPTGMHGMAYAINDSGLIAGAYGNASPGVDGSVHAFISNNGSNAIDLSRLIDPKSGWNLTMAMDINNLGQIATYGVGTDGLSHKLLLTPVGTLDPSQFVAAADGGSGVTGTTPTPVPEPSTLAFLGIVLAWMGRNRLGRSVDSR
jgi:probable HAF family extracellular repeat protein